MLFTIKVVIQYTHTKMDNWYSDTCTHRFIIALSKGENRFNLKVKTVQCPSLYKRINKWANDVITQ